MARGIRVEIPIITAIQMAEVVRRHLPQAEIEIIPMNPDYGSWRLMVTADDIRIEFSWGPLSGFGVTDFLKPTTDDDNPFAPYDIGFESIDAAEGYLIEHLNHIS